MHRHADKRRLLLVRWLGRLACANRPKTNTGGVHNMYTTLCRNGCTQESDRLLRDLDPSPLEPVERGRRKIPITLATRTPSHAKPPVFRGPEQFCSLPGGNVSFAGRSSPVGLRIPGGAGRGGVIQNHPWREAAIQHWQMLRKMRSNSPRRFSHRPRRVILRTWSW
jgi:hypothetical protein